MMQTVGEGFSQFKNVQCIFMINLYLGGVFVLADTVDSTAIVIYDNCFIIMMSCSWTICYQKQQAYDMSHSIRL